MNNAKRKNSTKKELFKALVTLSENKGYSNVTIEDICFLADRHRSTFYRYYESKDSLLREMEDYYLKATQQMIINFTQMEYTSYKSNPDKFKREVIEIWKFSMENRIIFNFLLNPKTGYYFHYKMKKFLYEIAEKIMIANHCYDPKKTYQLDFLVGGIFAVYTNFLKQNPGEIYEEEIIDFIMSQASVMIFRNYGLPIESR